MTKLNNLLAMTDTELRRGMQQAMRTLARNGLIADSGRRRASKRTGRLEVVWESKMVEDEGG
jgi:hypothetical protein